MDFKQLSETRRSIRAYDSSKLVSREQLEEIISSAIEAPSWGNSQTARFYCTPSGNMNDKVRECLPPFNAKNTAGAAYIVTTFVSGTAGFSASGGKQVNECGNGWGFYDLGLSSMLLTLKALEMGLGTLIMGVRDAEKLRALLKIPDSEVVVAVIAVGYPAINPEHTKRKPLLEVAKFF